ncbi:MAG: flotillin [Candidatus Binatia bacterium]|jgi:flotillin
MLMIAEPLVLFGVGVLVVVIIGMFALIARFYRKVEQGQAIIRNGMGGTKVAFTGMVVVPIAHIVEYMDISVNRLEVSRMGKDGLICKDNMRADIQVNFFIRVNKTVEDVIQVATTIGCERASDINAIRELFDAKFSEALKTVGRQFDFVQLYDSRESFRDEIIKIIGTDLNGYVLEDAAIDHLEQTKIEDLSPDNILDAEGIKKITDLTATQAKLTNQIERDKQKVIKQQDVEAREAILELERQQAEAEQKQYREISTVTSREQAEAKKIEHEQRLKSEQARIAAEEEINIAEENKNRQIIVARKNKERTEAVETERVEKDRQLEVTERERIVTLAQIEKEKAVEVEQKKIQDIIRERVMVEKHVVVEKEKIKDTEAFAQADRAKQVKITAAEMDGQDLLIKETKSAEAAKRSAELKADQDAYVVVKAAEAAKTAAEREAEQTIVKADAHQEEAERHANAKKKLAEATIAETAAPGLGEAQVITAKAGAIEKHGTAEAKVRELKLTAEATGTERQLTAEATGAERKFAADAKGITEKAEAMKLFDGVGREHEEFKLRLNKDKEIELAQISIQKDIAAEQAKVLGEALKSAKIDIVGGDQVFFDKIVNSITAGKQVDRLIGNSDTLRDVKDTFFNGDPDYFQDQLKGFIDKFGLSSEDLKNLTISAALGQLMTAAEDGASKGAIGRLMELAEKMGLKDSPVATLLPAAKKK